MDPVKLAEIEKNAAADKAALAEERAKNKTLLDNQRKEKIAAFAEKHKVYGLTAALKPAFESLAMMDISEPVKLSEGKELPFVDAVLAFAEGLINTKKIILGELAPADKGGEQPKADAVKLAEIPFEGYAKTNHMDIQGTELAVKAREYSEKNKMSYRTAYLAVAALNQEAK